MEQIEVFLEKAILLLRKKWFDSGGSHEIGKKEKFSTADIHVM